MKLIKHHKCLRGARLVLPILVLCFLANDARVNGQQLRDVFRSVQPAVVIVRTEQIGLAPFPQQGLVSSDGLGSGNNLVITVFRQGRTIQLAIPNAQ